MTNEYGRPSIGSFEPGGAGNASRANCPATNVTSGAATCSENSLLGPLSLADHPAFDPVAHRQHYACRGKIAHYASPEDMRSSPGPGAPAAAGSARRRAFIARRARAAAASRLGAGADDEGAYAAYLRRFAGVEVARPSKLATHVGLLALQRLDDDALIGVFNLSEIVRGAFQSAYLGYYAFAPQPDRATWPTGWHLVLARSRSGTLKLHRIEVNVQPANRPLVALVRRAGFTREGFSRRYVKIAGRWRDHERWAMLVEDWRARRAR